MQAAMLNLGGHPLRLLPWTARLNDDAREDFCLRTVHGPKRECLLPGSVASHSVRDRMNRVAAFDNVDYGRANATLREHTQHVNVLNSMRPKA